MARPRILVLAPLGWSLRSTLRTDLADLLAARADLTVATPLHDDVRLSEECSARNIALAPLRQYRIGRVSAWLADMGRASLFARAGTITHRVKLARELAAPLLRTRLRRRAGCALARALSFMPDRAWRRLGRLAWTPPGGLGPERALLDRVCPDLVYSTVPLSTRFEHPVLWVAADRRIPVATSITSFDNLTSKDRLPIRFTRTLVWSDSMRAEMLRFYPDTDPGSVVVTGAPQFDLHVRPGLRQTRASFLRALGAPEDRPLVLWSGVPATLMAREPEVVGQAAAALRDGALGRPVTLAYRPHPKAAPDWYEPTLRRFPEVIVTPTNEAGGGNAARWAPSVADVRTFCSSLAHAAVNVNFASTMTLDAAIHDLPVANVAFDDEGPGSVGSAWLRLAYTYDHFRPIVETGAARVCESLDALMDALRAYLRDPGLDAAARRRVVETLCGPVDGRSAWRVAAALLEMLGLNLGQDESPARLEHA